MATRVSKLFWLGAAASGATLGPGPATGEVWVVRDFVLQNLHASQRISGGKQSGGVFYAFVDNGGSGPTFQLMHFDGYQVLNHGEVLFMFGALDTVHCIVSGYSIT